MQYDVIGIFNILIPALVIRGAGLPASEAPSAIMSESQSDYAKPSHPRRLSIMLPSR
jgi:hypothetical protein